MSNIFDLRRFTCEMEKQKDGTFVLHLGLNEGWPLFKLPDQDGIPVSVVRESSRVVVASAQRAGICYRIMSRRPDSKPFFSWAAVVEYAPRTQKPKCSVSKMLNDNELVGVISFARAEAESLGQPTLKEMMDAIEHLYNREEQSLRATAKVMESTISVEAMRRLIMVEKTLLFMKMVEDNESAVRNVLQGAKKNGRAR